MQYYFDSDLLFFRKRGKINFIKAKRGIYEETKWIFIGVDSNIGSFSPFVLYGGGK